MHRTNHTFRESEELEEVARKENSIFVYYIESFAVNVEKQFLFHKMTTVVILWKLHFTNDDVMLWRLTANMRQ